MPWIQYAKTLNAQTYIQTPVESQGFASFVTSSLSQGKLLNFTLAQYDINGEFLGFTQLKDQLSICPLSYDEVRKMMTYGTISKFNCDFYLNNLK